MVRIGPHDCPGVECEVKMCALDVQCGEAKSSSGSLTGLHQPSVSRVCEHAFARMSPQVPVCSQKQGTLAMGVLYQTDEVGRWVP